MCLHFLEKSKSYVPKKTKFKNKVKPKEKLHSKQKFLNAANVCGQAPKKLQRTNGVYARKKHTTITISYGSVLANHKIESPYVKSIVEVKKETTSLMSSLQPTA